MPLVRVLNDYTSIETGKELYANDEIELESEILWTQEQLNQRGKKGKFVRVEFRDTIYLVETRWIDEYLEEN